MKGRGGEWYLEWNERGEGEESIGGWKVMGIYQGDVR